MRKFLVAAAVATTALTAAAPAAAQYYPAPVNPYQQPYYGQGYGYGYGQNNYGLVRSYEVRLANIRRAIERADSRDRLSEREARSLRIEARYLQQRVRALSYNGLNVRERRDLNVRLARLEQRFAYELRDGNRRPGYGYGNNWSDRDRDGRNDRYEDDRGRNPDGHWLDRDRDGRDDRYEDDRGRYPG